MNFKNWIVLGLIAIVTCVAGNSSLALAESARFSGIGKQVISDKLTGLSWQKGDSFQEIKKGMSWYEAVDYVNKKNKEKFGGFQDWRLPTMDELKNIWDETRPLRSKDGEPVGLPPLFANGGSYYLWTANERNLDHAWYFGLGQKEEYFNLKELGDLEQGVKMVRSSKKSGKKP